MLVPNAFNNMCIAILSFESDLVHVFINTITYMVVVMEELARICIHRRGTEGAERDDFYVCR